MSPEKKRMIRISPADNVAVALADLKAGELILCGDRQVRVSENVSCGHKVSLQSLQQGEAVIKYGVPIGVAAAPIEAGCWVHTHNMKTALSGETRYTYDGEKRSGSQTFQSRPHAGELAETFQGFLRPDGTVGIRNEVWILPLVGCVNDVAKQLADRCGRLVSGSVDGIYAFPHPYGCSQTGFDHRQTRRFLASLAKHPNAGAVLIVGLGCENLTMEEFQAELGDYDPNRIRFLVCQDWEDELQQGEELLKQCLSYAADFTRQKAPVSRLTIGLKCGGSDGFSGITANPAVGKFSDIFISAGGSTVLTEVPEMFGAEAMLLPRCADRQVFDQAAAMLNGFKRYFLSHGEKVYENPSPGNKAGGITTLEEKSCGCVQKGGTMPIVDVLEYGCRIRKRGLNLLWGPGNDLVSASALTAAGAQMILFTTGRGTPFGAPAPTVKISSNTRLARQKKRWIDFDAGPAAEGEDPDGTADRLCRLVLEIAEGKMTRSEEAGYREIAVWKDGVTL